MDLALNVVEGLRQIYDLQDAIRRQRRVNRKTYLRLMEIYVELEMSEFLQANATLQRTNAIEKFMFAVDTFSKYLRKYHDMHWHGRIFKHAAMEAERLKVVDEIDKLLRTLNLASNIAVINGQAVASTNAARLFAKLEHIHGDIKFTHDQIHAALLADRQQIELIRTKKMPEPEPMDQQRKRAPILKKCVSVVIVEKANTPPVMTQFPETTPESVVYHSVDIEEKAPAPTLDQSTDDDVGSDELKRTAPEDVQQSTVSAEAEEKEPVVSKYEQEQSISSSIEVESTLKEVEKVKLDSGEQNATSDVALKKEQTSLVESTNDEVMEEKEAKTSALVDNTVTVVTEEKERPSLVESTNDEVMEEVMEEKEGEMSALVDNTVETMTEEEEEQAFMVEGSFVDVMEKDEQTSVLVEITTDEGEEEAVNQTPQLEHNTSSSMEDSSVPLLIQLLGSSQATIHQKEQALLHLLRKCTTNSNRVQVYKTKGIPVLKDLVRNSENFFTQLYALHCLSWFTFSFSKMRESEFVELQSCVRQPTHPEILSLLHELQYEDGLAKEIAVLQCSCLATRGDGAALRRVGVLPPVIELLKNGTSNQKLWAAETLVTIASDDDDNCEAIMREGAIPPLVALLRSGTDMQKQEAAYALGNLAATNEVNRGKIAREGAIPPMVAFVKAVTDAQNQWAVYALGFLSVNNEENRVLIAQEGAIPPLVALLRTGTRAQKQWAAYTLGNLAHNDANRVEITQEGAITSLVELLRTGTAMVKQRAAFALGNLACDNDVATDFDEAIVPLVELVRSGSDSQKEDAAYTLGNLASNNDDRRDEIGRRGAIPPLVKLLETGHGDQKQWAAFALRYLAYNNDSNRVAIVEEGAIPALIALMDKGTDEQKEQASHALKHLVAKNDAITQAFIPDRVMTPLMGYLRAGAQNANVTALNTFGTVRDSVTPLFHRLVQPESPTQNQPVAASPPVLKAENKLVGTAGAW